MTPGLTLTIGGLAVLDMLSPATIGISLYVLLSGNRRLAAPMFVFLGTVAGFYFTVGVALMLGLDIAVRYLGDVVNSPVGLWAQLALGVGILVAAFVVPGRLSNAPRRPRNLRLGVMAALGVTTGLLEVGTALPYLGAIGIMTSAELSPGVWVPILAGYNLLMVLPPIILFAGYTLFGARIRPRLDRWRDKIESSGREAFGWILGIAGFLLARYAANELGLFTSLDGLGISIGI
ncbi:GAP family protein [Spiractinospora alimapuensis]|uniref:GAP family protein n=1 Tax=Spiractinospora alimapuensis TaxID=2820884 RepID=UPI001F35F74D|nr:GAP family protein [Spiractinospora alimapuensis]QVQ50138.1 GAP family protein [Spiractinospora alimapuensis]